MYLALRDGPRRFRQDFTCPALLRILLNLNMDSRTGLSPSMALFPAGSTSLSSGTAQSYNPGNAWTSPVWALARSLATTCAIIVIFFSCGYLDVSVPHVRSLLTVWLAFNQPGCPIRISWDQGLFAPPPSFSQLITSFVATESQGIHRLPFSYFFTRSLQFNWELKFMNYELNFPDCSFVFIPSFFLLSLLNRWIVLSSACSCSTCFNSISSAS